ncbi:MAG: DUF1501 domain-containing protein [Fuerstiella sp.]|nr:DUF1501 domain-containing protein [Fuerstiella sp.]
MAGTHGCPVASLTDLQQRGLLEETLVAWASQMGRTPFRNGAMGKNPGRQHNSGNLMMWMSVAKFCRRSLLRSRIVKHLQTCSVQKVVQTGWTDLCLLLGKRMKVRHGRQQVPTQMTDFIEFCIHAERFAFQSTDARVKWPSVYRATFHFVTERRRQCEPLDDTRR